MTYPSTNGSNGRDKRGRFTKGNPGGPGNPNSKQTSVYRKAIREAVSEEDVKSIMNAMVAAATKGDVNAAKFVMSYAVGSPKDYIDEFETERTSENRSLLKAIPRSLLVDIAKNPQKYSR